MGERPLQNQQDSPQESSQQVPSLSIQVSSRSVDSISTSALTTGVSSTTPLSTSTVTDSNLTSQSISIITVDGHPSPIVIVPIPTDSIDCGGYSSTSTVAGSGLQNIYTNAYSTAGHTVCEVVVNPGASTTGNSLSGTSTLNASQVPFAGSSSSSRNLLESSTPTIFPEVSQAPSPVASVPIAPAEGQTSSSEPAAASGPSSSLSTGAIAGIVVGIVIALILAGIAVLLFYRRKRRNRPESLPVSGSEKRFNPVHSVPITAHEKAWEEHLPIAADDATIKRELSTLFDQVELHVENFFSPIEVNGDPSGADVEPIATARFRNLSNLRPELIFKTENQLAIVKCYLAAIVVGALGYASDPFFSLLPPQFSTFPAMRSSAANERQQGRASEQARAQWRVLSAFLRPDMENDPAYVAGRDQKIRFIIEDFDHAFGPWIHDRYSIEEKVHNLSGILVKASRVGMLLFSQPTVFAFDWTVSSVPSRRSKTVVVTPAVSRGGEPGSRTHTEARTLVDARYVTL